MMLGKSPKKNLAPTNRMVEHSARNLIALSFFPLWVEYSEGGALPSDQTLRTSNRHIYAVGDCVSTIQLARVADKEAHVAAENILAELGLGRKAAMDYQIVPAVLLAYPQCGNGRANRSG